MTIMQHNFDTKKHIKLTNITRHPNLSGGRNPSNLPAQLLLSPSPISQPPSRHRIFSQLPKGSISSIQFTSRETHPPDALDPSFSPRRHPAQGAIPTVRRRRSSGSSGSSGSCGVLFNPSFHSPDPQLFINGSGVWSLRPLSGWDGPLPYRNNWPDTP